MSQPAEAARLQFYQLEEDGTVHDSGTLLGFWIYLMSDALLFATLFATFGVLSSNFAGGPGPRELFDLGVVAVNTGILLLSAALGAVIGGSAPPSDVE